MTERSDPGDTPLTILDAHVHIFDSTVNRHAFLDRPDPTMEALVGDYSSLPRRYLLDDYLADSRHCRVTGIVCHEYLASDPVAEMRWLQRQADAANVAVAIVALADFLDPRLEERLDAYRSLPAITAVRQHLGWDDIRPGHHFAGRPDLLKDPAWRRGLARIEPYGYRCGLEVFGPQLPDLVEVVRSHPGIGFTVAVLGWPLDLGPAAFGRWRRDMAALASCTNTRLSVSAIECIFGMGWTIDQVRPWLLTAVELFGPDRVMLGSHLPICRLSHGFARLYQAYRDILAGFLPDEQDQMFRRVAAEWFGVI